MNNDDNDNAIFYILKDFIYLYFLVALEISSSDDDLICIYDTINSMLIPVFIHEFVISGYINKDELDKNNLKLLRNLRTEYLKNTPKADGDLIKKLITETGLNFDNNMFDIVLAVNKKNSNELLGINFIDFIMKKTIEENGDAIRKLIRIPATIIAAVLEKFGMDYLYFYKTTVEPASIIALKKVKEKYTVKQYSYSSNNLFCNSTLNDQEKYFILFRYSFVKQSLIVKELQPLSLSLSETITVDSDLTVRKIKALAIETIYRDIKNLNIPIGKTIGDRINKLIKNKDFFAINRKMRNNIHYNHFDDFTDYELAVLDEYQDKYLSIVVEIFDDNIFFDFGYKYKLKKWIAEKTDMNFREKVKGTDYDYIKFKDIFNTEY